jgi:hypothetical protein
MTAQEAEGEAWSHKIDAFGVINRLTSIWSRPKDEEFDLIYKELRYQPFWHVAVRGKYIYDRKNSYHVPTSGNEVKSVSFENRNFDCLKGEIILDVVEHCLQEPTQEVLVDGLTGEKREDFRKYIGISSKEIVGKDLQSTFGKTSVVVPPQFRVSGIMREMLSKMIQGIQADKIFEEKIEVTCVDLYYYPVYAFQYNWKKTNKQALVEIDGVTKKIRSGGKTFKEYLGKVIDRDFIFDLSSDVAGMLIPGGSIAVKVAKKYVDNKKK